MEEESRFSWLKLLLALVVGAAAWLLLGGLYPNPPEPDAVNPRLVGAVYGMAVTLWVTEALPLAVTAIVSTLLLVLVAGVEDKKAFGAFGEPTILLFVGSFMLAKAMEVSGLSARIAWTILKRPFATRSSGMLLLTFGATITSISLFVSNTATAAMMLPIGLGIVRSLKRDSKGEPFAVAGMLTVAWMASIAVGTILSTPPNLIGRDLIQEATGTEIDFLTWMMFGMPITIVMFIVVWVVIRVFFGGNPPDTRLEAQNARQEAAALGPLRVDERNTMVAFFTALVLWVVPGLVNLAWPKNAWVVLLDSRMTEAVAALIGASLLFLLPGAKAENGGYRQTVLTWRQAAQIDWGTIFLFAGGIALGKAMFDSGLAEAIGTYLASTLGVSSVWSVTALCIAVAVIMSELSSNTASATTIVPVAIGIAKAANISPLAPALGAALGASLGFMLPISTPPNAIVFSSGLIKPSQMLKAGIVVDIVGFAVVLAMLALLLPMMGLM